MIGYLHLSTTGVLIDLTAPAAGTDDRDMTTDLGALALA